MCGEPRDPGSRPSGPSPCAFPSPCPSRSQHRGSGAGAPQRKENRVGHAGRPRSAPHSPAADRQRCRANPLGGHPCRRHHAIRQAAHTTPKARARHSHQAWHYPPFPLAERPRGAYLPRLPRPYDHSCSHGGACGRGGVWGSGCGAADLSAHHDLRRSLRQVLCLPCAFKAHKQGSCTAHGGEREVPPEVVP